MKIIRQLSGAIIILLIAVTVWIFYGAGLFTHIDNEFAGSCKAVLGAPGSEDITVDHDQGIAYLSSLDRGALTAVGDVEGDVYALDLTLPGAQPVNLTQSLNMGFDPHGLSLWKNPDGLDRLFVVNHHGGEHSVEIFEITPAGLRHIRKVSGTAMNSPNDIVAVGPDRFFATNDSYFADDFLLIAEKFLRLPINNVVYYDGNRFNVSITTLAFPNGINVAPDGSALYVATWGGRDVHLYDRDPVSGVLTNRRLVDLPGSPDNIEVMPDGKLIIGVHSRIAKLFFDTANAPSRIVRVDPQAETMEIIFDNDGTEIVGASVGSLYDNRLIVGAIADPRILDCTFNHQSN